MPIAPEDHNRQILKLKKHTTARHNRQATRLFNTGSKAWRQIRERVLVRGGYTCTACEKWGNEVDHVDGDSHNNQQDNLQILCKRCHSSKTMKAVNAKQ